MHRTDIPHGLYRYNPQKKSCLPTNDRRSFGKDALFQTLQDCKTAYARKANLEAKGQQCSGHPNDVCQRGTGRPSRYCIVESDTSVECAPYSNIVNGLTLCFGYEYDCKSYLEKNYRVWFYSPKKDHCMKTKSELKKPGDVYHMSRKECEKMSSERRRAKSCHKIQNNACQQVPDKKPCNLLEYSFNSHQDCMECLSKSNEYYIPLHDLIVQLLGNYDNPKIAFMTHKGNKSNTMVSVRQFGPYYMKLKCHALDLESRHAGPMYMFKSKEKCMEKYREDKELQERSVGYRYRLGDCRPTMDLKSPGLFKTKDECRSGSHNDEYQYAVPRGAAAWYHVVNQLSKFEVKNVVCRAFV
uniref:Uncharacterized protein n=1 Tax=Romanomermis culicivorax TaxID=13658 RepID=A0A915HQD1_ROMCU